MGLRKQGLSDEQRELLPLTPEVFFVLFAHVGVGLQLRNPALKRRASKRRTHVITASLIVLAIALHVVLLRAGS